MWNGGEDFKRFLRDLREAREYRGITLGQVSDETCINLEFLEALEAGEWDRISGPYLRGYLISYAECVGMVREKVLRRFEELEYRPVAATAGRALASRPMTVPTPATPVQEPVAPRPPRRESFGEAATASEPREEAVPPAVPSLWQVVPKKVKLGAALLLAVLLVGLVWGLAGLIEGAGSGDGPEDFERTLEQARSEAESKRFVLQNFDPSEISFRLRRPAALRAFTRDSIHFAGTLKADSQLTLRSTAEMTLQVERLEDLELILDGDPVELPADSGRAEVRVSRRGTSVIRRSP